jgi:hypothetical protein
MNNSIFTTLNDVDCHRHIEQSTRRIRAAMDAVARANAVVRRAEIAISRSQALLRMAQQRQSPTPE